MIACVKNIHTVLINALLKHWVQGDAVQKDASDIHHHYVREESRLRHPKNKGAAQIYREWCAAIDVKNPKTNLQQRLFFLDVITHISRRTTHGIGGQNNDGGNS